MQESLPRGCSMVNPVLLLTLRRCVSIAVICALSACGGGGGGSAPALAAAATPTPGPTASATPLVTAQFVISFPAGGQSAQRSAQRISPSTHSVTIVLTNPPSGITATTVTSTIVPASCPCTVNGPAAPARTLDDYTLSTFASTDGSGSALDTGTTSVTPVENQNTPVSVTLKGIPAIVAIGNVPAAFAANATASQALTITVQDAASQAIASGTYAHPVTIAVTDSNAAQGAQLSGTHAGSCTSPTTCVSMTGPADTATLAYGGIAEAALTISSSGTGLTSAGTATFTPVLNAITGDAANSTSSLGGTGIDLFTATNEPVGYTGTVSYKELGFTNTPYNKGLVIGSTVPCSTFAAVTTGANASNETPFTATAIPSPAVGVCSLTVTDGLADQLHPLPSFYVTYTTSTIGASGTHRTREVAP